MPTYDYGCNSCDCVVEQTHLMSENPEYDCPKCGKKLERMFSPNGGGFIFKGGTDSINYREKRIRKKRSEELKVKQLRHKHDSPKVQPNIAGVRTDSWSDAQKMAKEAGMNHQSYTPYVEKEKKKKIIV